jgi:UDP-glucosyltransferase BX8/BX9
LSLATETTTNSSGAIINTFKALETHELEMIRIELQDTGIPTFAAGPLHNLTSTNVAETSLLHNLTSSLGMRKQSFRKGSSPRLNGD